MTVKSKLPAATEAGMTLLEAMTALALVAVLCAIALPDFLHSFLPGYRLLQAVRRLRGDMISAKMLAVSSNRQHRIVFDTAGDAWYLEIGNRSSQSSSWSRQQRCCLSEPMGNAYCPGVHLSSASARHLVLNPEGAQSAVSVTLRLEQGRGVKILTATAGRIRMERVP
jgi:Tfp pilus assembly protein FimT